MAGDGMPNQPGPEHQTEVYMEGRADATPDLSVASEDLEAALESMDEKSYGYVAGGRAASRLSRTTRRRSTSGVPSRGCSAA